MPTNGQIHLPSWDTQKDVYARFRDDKIQQKLKDSDIISLTCFIRYGGKIFHMWSFQRYIYTYVCQPEFVFQDVSIFSFVCLLPRAQSNVCEAMQVSLFYCAINMLCCIMSCNVTNHAMYLIGLL